jgi:hypothetical protein
LGIAWDDGGTETSVEAETDVRGLRGTFGAVATSVPTTPQITPRRRRTLHIGDDDTIRD